MPLPAMFTNARFREQIAATRRQTRVRWDAQLVAAALLPLFEAGDYERISEEDLQRLAMAWFTANGWLVFHDLDSRRNTEGLPDLICLKADRLLWIELKSEDGPVRPDQRLWASALVEAGQQYFCLRPSDWRQLRDLAHGR